MKKLLLYFLCLVVGLIGIDLILGKVLAGQLSSMPEDGDRLAKINYAINHVEADIIIVGASDARTTINTKILTDSLSSYSLYNCGIDAQPTFVCDVVLNCIINRTTPKYILWVVRPDALKKTDEGLGDLSLLFPFYSNDYVKHRLDNTEVPFLSLKLKSQTYRYNGNAPRILKAKFFPDPTTYLGFTELDGDCSGMGEIQKDINKDFCINEKLIESMKCTLERMEDSGITVFFILTPKYPRNISENLYVKTLDSLRLKYKNTYLIDDSQVDSLICNGKYFRDVDHLNARGSRLYTKKLFGKIKPFLNNNQNTFK